MGLVGVKSWDAHNVANSKAVVFGLFIALRWRGKMTVNLAKLEQVQRMITDRALSPDEQCLFADYLVALKRQRILFVLLRNYEGFPEHIGHDLDLFVRRCDALKARHIFLELLASAGGTLLIVHERDYFIDLRFILNPPIADSVHLDIYHSPFTWHGLPYLADEKLLVDARQYNGLPVPRPAHEALNILFASILWGGFYKARYQPRIASLLASPEEYAEFNRCVQAAFGLAGKPPFDPRSSTLPEKTGVKAYAVRLRRAFKRHSFSKAPLKTLTRLARHWSVEIGCLLHPTGLVIVLTGPDESTNKVMIDGLFQRIRELFTEGEVHYSQSYTQLSGGTSNSVSAFFRLLRNWFRCWLSWPVLGWKSKAQSKLVILDRHTDDWWRNPDRYGFSKLPSWLLKLFANSTLQPDFKFLLTPKDSRLPSAILDCFETTLVAYLREHERPS